MSYEDQLRIGSAIRSAAPCCEPLRGAPLEQARRNPVVAPPIVCKLEVIPARHYSGEDFAYRIRGLAVSVDFPESGDDSRGRHDSADGYAVIERWRVRRIGR